MEGKRRRSGGEERHHPSQHSGPLQPPRGRAQPPLHPELRSNIPQRGASLELQRQPLPVLHPDDDCEDELRAAAQLRRSDCRSLFSTISVKSLEVSPSLSLDVRIMRLWW
ncbi:hypothetical protein C2S53_009018 [Perilla frutescens var. hirtella]|uniref:Uncharacterized protein n=1 Tax=Perilla frutescens var. hirtella TaxID=608512 RepID=A0AAD4IWC0_PERFH|nr:hypothetical protein C2S53_009018 [Perilla frutescens var. hirtella]